MTIEERAWEFRQRDYKLNIEGEQSAAEHGYTKGATDMVQRAVELYKQDLEEIIAVINRFSKSKVGDVISIEGSVKDFENKLKGE